MKRTTAIVGSVVSLLFLGCATTTGPQSSAVTTAQIAEVKRLHGMLYMLNRVELRIVEYQATKPVGYQWFNESRAINEIRAILQLAPSCPEGSCEENGICVPCSPPRLVRSVAQIENRLLTLYAKDPAAYDQVAPAVAGKIYATWRIFDLADPDCEPGGCWVDGICEPCLIFQGHPES